MSTTSFCSQDECLDIFLDNLEIAVHQILYARKLYPTQAFQKTQKLNVVVYKCIHPEVASFIAQGLATTRKLMLDNFVEKFVVVVMKDNQPIEKFVFGLNSYFKTTSSDGKAALDYGEITRQTRAIWLTIISRFSNDFQHSGNSTFTFEIHTRNTAYEKLLHEQTTEDFQWIVTENSSQPTSVLPVRRLQSQPFDVDIYVEDLTH